MKKVCVFCGGKPTSKTKEHVIPTWLLKLTGDPNRVFNLGMNLRKKDFSHREFPGKNLHFPACDCCNNEFSKFESRAKIILEKILENMLVDGKEISTFFDWFDRVRVGLWLAYRYLDDNHWNVDPNYFIKNRIGIFDRMIAVYVCNDKGKGIWFTGIQTPGFSYMPSCFSLMVNSFIFFNVSTDFLFARRIGFPYPSEIYVLGEKGGIPFNGINPPKKRIMKPVIRKRLHPAILIMYQPVIRKEIIKYYSEYYKDDYVKGKMLIEREGKGKILIEQGDNIDWLSNKLKILDGKYDYKKEDRLEIFKEICMQTLHFQKYLFETPSLSKLQHEEQINVKRLRRSVKRVYNVLIKKCDKWKDTH